MKMTTFEDFVHTALKLSNILSTPLFSFCFTCFSPGYFPQQVLGLPTTTEVAAAAAAAAAAAHHT